MHDLACWLDNADRFAEISHVQMCGKVRPAVCDLARDAHTSVGERKAAQTGHGPLGS